MGARLRVRCGIRSKLLARVAAGEEIVIARAGKPVARLVPIEEKLELPEPPARYVPTRLERGGFTPMSVEHAHALRVFELPRHHRDPFDRLLIAQAQLEGATLATADPMFLLYDIDALWAGAGEPPQAVHDADGRRRKVAGSVDSNGVRRRTRSRSRTGSAASRRSRASQGRKPK